MPPASPSRQNTTKKWFCITRFARSDPKSHFCCGGAAWRGCGCGRHGCTTPRVPSLRLLSTSMSKRLRVNTLTQLIFLVDGVAARHKLRATCRITRRKHMHAAARGQRKRMQRLLVNVRHTATSQHPQNKIQAEALHQNAEAKQNGKAFYKRGRGLTWSSWSSCGDCLQWCWNSMRTL